MTTDVRPTTGIEIRPLVQEEMEQFWENLRIGFSSGPRPQRPPNEPEPPPEILPEWTLCAFDGGKLATTYAAFPFEMYFNGKLAPAAGVTAVTTLPWFRRRGHLRSIMEIDFARMHEQGGPAIAILYASMAAIYQRFGYAIVSTHVRYQIEPYRIEFAVPEPVHGSYRLIERDNIDELKRVYDRFAARRTGFLKRTDHIWQHNTIGYGPNRPLIVAYEEHGEVQGFVIYTAEQKGRDALNFDGSVIASAWDLAWLTPSAYRGLWSYLKNIDLARELNVYGVPLDDPAPNLFLEPRQLYPTHIDGLLARITDVERALPQREYNGEGRITFEVFDAMAPWNTGRWEMETDGVETRAQRSDRQPELTMPVSTLAPLLFGHFSASEGARMGRLTVHDPAALRRWDALLRTEYAPGCANGF